MAQKATFFFVFCDLALDLDDLDHLLGVFPLGIFWDDSLGYDFTHTRSSTELARHDRVHEEFIYSKIIRYLKKTATPFCSETLEKMFNYYLSTRRDFLDVVDANNPIERFCMDFFLFEMGHEDATPWDKDAVLKYTTALIATQCRNKKGQLSKYTPQLKALLLKVNSTLEKNITASELKKQIIDNLNTLLHEYIRRYSPSKEQQPYSNG